VTDYFLYVDTSHSAADSRHSRKRKWKHSSDRNIDRKTLPKASNHDGFKQHVRIRRKQKKNTNCDSLPSSERPAVVTCSSKKKNRGVKKVKRKQKSTSL